MSTDTRRRALPLVAALVLAAVADAALAAPAGVWAAVPAPARGSLASLGPGTILDQPPNESCALVSDAGESQVIADNFVVSGAEEVALVELRFSGAYLFNNVPPPGDVFEVRVHPDDAGLPGASVVTGCAHSGVVPSSRTPNGRSVGGFDLFDLVVPLRGSCRLAPGATYWIEIYEGVASGDRFSWECGDADPVHGVPGSAVAFVVPGSNWVATDPPTDHALAIVGALFADGFESGDATAWSNSTP
jgi:hypothetical protein